MQADRVLAELGRVLHRVDVGRAVEVAGPALDGLAEGDEAEGLARLLAIAREPEPPALHPGPAPLTLVAVDGSPGPPGPAEHQQLDVPILVDEVARVAAGNKAEIRTER